MCVPLHRPGRSGFLRRCGDKQTGEVDMRFINNMKTALLLGGMMGLCMLVGYFVAGPHGMLFGLF